MAHCNSTSHEKNLTNVKKGITKAKKPKNTMPARCGLVNGAEFF
jgi:hypothetical protein